MQPITVSVGPLQTASANCICHSQTPNAGTLVLNGTPAAGSSTTTFQGTGAISGAVLTISATSSGALAVGTVLAGQGVAGGTKIIGVGPGGVANTWLVQPAQTVSSTTIYGNQLVTLDNPRQVLITTAADESAHTFTISGTDWAGTPISETVAGANIGTTASTLSYATVSQITISANATGAVTVGTNTVASSPWARFDPWSNSYISVQCNATGTVNYTLQQTLDDPNQFPPGSLAPSGVTWVNSNDSAAVGATGTIQTNYGFTPIFARVLLNSGTGTVKTTFVQSEVVNR